MSDNLHEQLMQSWRLKAREGSKSERAFTRSLKQSPGLYTYVPNAEVKFWLQRIAFIVLVGVMSSLFLWQVCLAVPTAQAVLFGFFKWILIPIKPLLIAAPSPAASGFVSFLTGISSLLNLAVIPIAGVFALKAAESPLFLHLRGQSLYVLESGYNQRFGAMSQNRIGHTLYVETASFVILNVVTFDDDTRIKLHRPRGKKSTKDYVLIFAGSSGFPLKIRWGDIVSPEERGEFFEQLEQKFPTLLEPELLEPFRPMVTRQSYTELWLRELSDAPKRDKLTPLAEGSTLDKGNYVILSKAGVGGQGTAYFAESKKHEALGHAAVVLKEYVLPVYPDVRVRRKAAERFQAEAAMLGRLDHPQIAKFIDLFLEDHRAYVVMELVEGRSLKETVATQGPFPERAVIDIAVQILEILCYLHSQNPPVIHRDLTPDNIMFGLDGRVKLIDFSVAQEASSGVTGSVVGKPNYISPEQFRGKPTTQSDLYSLGATMFFLLVGVDPSPISVLHPHAQQENVSENLDGLIARCTQPELIKRYKSAEQVLKDLREL